MKELLLRIEQSFLTGDLAGAQHLLCELKTRSFSRSEVSHCLQLWRRVKTVIAKSRARDSMLRSLYFGQQGTLDV